MYNRQRSETDFAIFICYQKLFIKSTIVLKFTKNKIIKVNKSNLKLIWKQ